MITICLIGAALMGGTMFKSLITYAVMERLKPRPKSAFELSQEAYHKEATYRLQRAIVKNQLEQLQNNNILEVYANGK